MKIKIQRSKINKKLNNVSKAISQVSHLPALLGIKITVNESKLVMLASDGNLSIEDSLSTQSGLSILEQGSVLVPGRLFKEVISKQEEEITITTDENKMIVESTGSKTEIQLFNKDDYPRISFEGFGKDLAIDSTLLKSIIKNVGYAAAREDRRIILNGINLKAKDGQITASATNSFRLAQEKTMINSTVEFDFTILTKKLRDFIPADCDGEMIINVDDEKIITKNNDTIISSRLIDGVYPPIEKLFVNEFSTLITINKKELEKTIDRVTVVSTDSNKVIKLTLDNDGLSFEGRKSEKGYSNSKIIDFKREGDDIEIAFDAHFLKEAISNLEGKIILSFNGSFKPFQIKSESNENLTQIILPHRTL